MREGQLHRPSTSSVSSCIRLLGLPSSNTAAYTEVYLLTVLETRSPRLRHQQGCFYSACDGGLLLLFLYDLPSAHIRVLISTSRTDTGHVGLGSTHVASFYPNLLLKGSISKESHSKILGMGLQYMNSAHKHLPSDSEALNPTPSSSLHVQSSPSTPWARIMSFTLLAFPKLLSIHLLPPPPPPIT